MKEINMDTIRFRRGTLEQVNLDTRRLEKWHVFKFTAPVEFRGAYGAVDGVWKWATAAERDEAMKRMKAIGSEQAAESGEGKR